MSSEKLYAAVWRWHFFAGLFVAPFVLLLAITGGAYLFKPQIEEWLYADLYETAPAARSITAEAQVQAALSAFPGKVVAYAPAPTAQRSALVRVEGSDGRYRSVAVDPHTGSVLGAIDEQRRPMQIVRELHGKLLSGTAGQALQELAASWAMVLLVTGLYLWWPRVREIHGTLVPRLRARGRTFWRDVHAVTGFWVALLLVFLVVTGLPWTLVSAKVITAIAAHVGKGTPDIGLGWDGAGSTTVKSNRSDQGWATDHAEHKAGHAHSQPAAGAARLPLDRVIAIARGLDGLPVSFEIRLPVDAQGVYSIVTDSVTDPAGTAYVHIDQYSGAVISDVRWHDFGPLAKGIALGVSIHEGRYFGLANQLLGLTACLGLGALVCAGIVMWWRRRPAGSLAAPPGAQDFRIGPGIVSIVVVLGALMPLMAGSLLLVLAAQWALRFKFKIVQETRE